MFVCLLIKNSPIFLSVDDIYCILNKNKSVIISLKSENTDASKQNIHNTITFQSMKQKKKVTSFLINDRENKEEKIESIPLIICFQFHAIFLQQQ